MGKRNLDSQAEAVTSEVAAIDQAMARVEANRNKPEEGAKVVSISQNDPLAERDKEERTRKAARPRKPKIESSPDLKVDGQMRDDPTITFSTKLHLTVAQELNRLYHERATLGLHPYRKMDLVEEGLRMVFDKYGKNNPLR